MVCAILSCSTAVDHTPGLKKVSFVILSYLVDLDIRGQDFGYSKLRGYKYKESSNGK